MDIVLSPIISRLVDTLIGLANEELHLILGVPKEIKKLRELLCLIQDVLNDAQQRQITEPGVKRWLSCLTDVMYDADDILDEYRIAALEKASSEHPPEEPSVGCWMWPTCFRQVKFTHEISSKIKDLNLRLEEISAIKSTLDLRVSDKPKVLTRVGRETSSKVEPDIVGEVIEKNTRDLVELLVRKEEDTNANVVVLAIVGIGGIGKTTLAQKVFSDQKIKAVFQKTMWVCVSQEFVATDLLKEIIKSAGGSPGEAQSKEQLEKMVNDVLNDSKFLLVLDDVWDAQIWIDWLRTPLLVGALESRVLVTTRNRRVAEQMMANHIHSVDPLPLDDSWLLLCKKVIKKADELIDVQSLKDIGMRIVEKCQGLPLAITAIGGVLCGKLSRWEWERVEHSSAWSRTGLPDGVHQALYLSYEDLPSHLKQCFLYCSLFREDSELNRETLVQLWVAEGFVVKVEGEEYLSLEEIAQGYYDELIQRSLLQEYGEGNYNYTYYSMHDLLRSLCHSLERGKSSVVTDIYKQIPSTADDDSIKLRRLSIVALESQDIKPFLHLTQRHKSVRTLLLNEITYLDDEEIDNCFNNFQRLRVVHLGYAKMQSLPQSVGNLLHLRYLNLSFCSELKALPESIERLKNLQFLILWACIRLHTLPKGLIQLRNLRTLDLVAVHLELPSGIVRLEHLNVLKGALVTSISIDNSSSSFSLEEISQLRKLRQLSINLKMTNLEQEINCLNGLLALEDLVDLDLSCYPICQVANYMVEIERIEMIFDMALHPPTCVRHIEISFFFGRQFPRWLMSSSINSFLPNLTNLVLEYCRSCSLLPPLGKLPNLDSLVLKGLDAVRSIGAEFYGYEEASTSDGLGRESEGSKNASSSPVLFPHLKLLHLIGLENLKAWHWVPEDGGIVAMPRLNQLKVDNCPKLLSLPDGLIRQAIHLTKLDVHKTNLNSISGFPSVKKLWISGEPGLKIVSHLPTLEVLEVHLTGEQSLSLPDWLVQGLPHFTSLQRLQLKFVDKQLLHRCLQDGPDWPKIRHIPAVEITDGYGSYIKYIKHSSTFETNLI